MIISFVRTIILYFMVIFALRLMGKRQIGELQPSELVVAIMIAELSSVPMSDTAIPLATGIVPILTLIIAEVSISYLNLKSETIRNIVTGMPSIIIKNGVLSEKEMIKSRFNIEDLMEELRMKNYYNISDIYMAVLETNGELTVIPRSDKAPVTAGDFSIKKEQERPSLILISDGKLRKQHLKESGYDRKWLMEKLSDKGISRIKDVFLFSIDSSQKIFIQIKNRGK